ncbi:MAG: diguanylate cyclase [Chloroflexota bacterium]|nr:diguanylate cyclase [Chloroflexota bacterium]
MPLWLGSGLADWWFHRRSSIERTAGAYESLIHLLMLAEAGAPAMLGLFLEVNAGVLLPAFSALVAHEATAIWDVAYAETRRRVTPAEQHVHSFLEVGPLMAVVLLTVLHWDQGRALMAAGGVNAEFALRPKRHPLGRAVHHRPAGCAGGLRGGALRRGVLALLPAPPSNRSSTGGGRTTSAERSGM